MVPPFKSSRIPKPTTINRKSKTSNPAGEGQARHEVDRSRALSTTPKGPNPDDVPEPVAQSADACAAPQCSPSSQLEVGSAANEGTSLVDDICKNHIGPLSRKISEMEKCLATSVAVCEDARAQLGLLA